MIKSSGSALRKILGHPSGTQPCSEQCPEVKLGITVARLKKKSKIN